MPHNRKNVAISFLLLLVAMGMILIINRLTAPKGQLPLIDADEDGHFTIAVEDKGVDCNDADSSIYPVAKEIEGDGIDQDCDGFDKLPVFDPNQLSGKYDDLNEFLKLRDAGAYLKIFSDYVTPTVLDSETIIKNSKIVRAEGEFESAYLFVQASVGSNGDKLAAGESVYFYVDTGDTGGHLIKSRSLAVDDEKLENTHTNLLYKAENIPLTSRPYKEVDTPVLRTVDLLTALNNKGVYNREHYIGAFVSSTKKPAAIINLGIAFKCKPDSNCSIKLQNQ